MTKKNQNHVVQKLVLIGGGGKMRTDLLAEKLVCLQTQMRVNDKTGGLSRTLFDIGLRLDGVCLPKRSGDSLQASKMA